MTAPHLKRILLVVSLATVPLPAVGAVDAVPACDEHKAQTRLVPHVKDGKPHGLKVFAIQPGSLYERAGFKNGDVFLTIDSKPVTSPAPDPLEAAAKAAKKGHSLSIAIERSAKRLTLTLNV